MDDAVLGLRWDSLEARQCGILLELEWIWYAL